MINRRKHEAGPADYDFGTAHELPENLKDNELFQSSSWIIAKEVLRDSFVISSGRQYAQLCDMTIAAALIDEQGIPFDRTIFNEPDAIEAIQKWKLPPSHTGKPTHTPGLVEGGHEFWWRMLGDAFAWRFEGSELLPDEQAIAERFRACGIPRYQTSSSTYEELASLDRAMEDVREARFETSDQLAMRSLKWHLKVAFHWLSHKRPRTDRRDAAHEERWRSGMLAALDAPVAERTLYDQILVKQAGALDTLLAMTPEELTTHNLRPTRELHDEALNLYNYVHKSHLLALHHRSKIETTIPVRATSALGAVGLISTQETY